MKLIKIKEQKIKVFEIENELMEIKLKKNIKIDFKEKEKIKTLN